ncbi:hypothetical protein JCM17823_04710 [Halorubrum gandharaense]
MERYEPVIRNGVLHLETETESVTIGELESVVSAVGTETYTVEYDDRQQTVAWLNTDEGGRLSFDVAETVTDMTYDEEFLDNLRSVDADAVDEDGRPLRASVFADMLTAIWDAKGDL